MNCIEKQLNAVDNSRRHCRFNLLPLSSTSLALPVFDPSQSSGKKAIFGLCSCLVTVAVQLYHRPAPLMAALQVCYK